MQLRNFEPRSYQKAILETCKEKNTLVVLPTGTGKTPIALMLAAERLAAYPRSKILITAPTKPLCSQHMQSFRASSTLHEEVILLTGSIPPEKRSLLWNEAKVIVATPQTIESDLEQNRINLKEVSLLCLDECHRSRQHYASTILVKKLLEQSPYPRILGLTASPGSTHERIQEICSNLSIEAVEIRTEEDEDMKPYIKEKLIEWIKLDVPKEIENISSRLRQVHKNLLSKVKELGYNKPVQYINRKDLLMMQADFRKQITRGNPSAFYGISLIAQIIKLDHLITLLETQSFQAVGKYWEKLKEEETKAAKAILSSSEVRKSVEELKAYKQKVHPKMEKLIELIKEELRSNPSARMIVFANYRDIVAEITDNCNAAGIDARRFVGQADKAGDKGLKQKEQMALLQEFKQGSFPVLTASSVGEEGLDIPEVSAVIFYEPVPSELRRVQRAGRTGRTKAGKVIFFMMKKTLDEAYYWTSMRKEKRMKNILKHIKAKNERQGTL